MQIAPTESNITLASSVRNRVRAEGSLVAAKAMMWRSIGIGTMALMIGGGIGCGLYGYSYATDNRTSAEKMANAFAVALEHANLGTVRLDPKANSVSLTAGATVALAPGGTVALSPNVVRLETDALIRPSERQLHGDSPSKQSSGKIVTNFTIFKSVPFGVGLVDTGWRFDNNEQLTPTSQYCRYRQKTESGKTVVVDLANDGQMLFTAPTYSEIDGIAAATQCVWFNGQPTTGSPNNRSEQWGK